RQLSRIHLASGDIAVFFDDHLSTHVAFLDRKKLSEMRAEAVRNWLKWPAPIRQRCRFLGRLAEFRHGRDELAGFDLREVQYLVDQTQEVSPGGIHAAHRFQRFFRAEANTQLVSLLG